MPKRLYEDYYLHYSMQQGSKCEISDQHFKGAWSETQTDL